MKKKNLKHYRSAFSHIDEDQFNRIQNYLKENPLNKNQVQKFKEAILTHKEYSSWVTIVFYAIPEPTPRPKFGNSRFYVKNSDSNRTFMNKFYSLEQANLPHITGECALDLDLYFPIPKSFNRVDTLLAEIGMLRPAKRPAVCASAAGDLAGESGRHGTDRGNGASDADRRALGAGGGPLPDQAG